MELTPHSTHSPNSPYHYPSDSQPVYEYPSPAQSDSRHKSTESLQGLALYSCQMSSSSSTADGSTVPHLASSAPTNWPTAALQHRGTTPNLSTRLPHPAEYSAYGPVPVSSSYSHDIYAPSTAEVSVISTSPLPSSNASQRSSFSSAPASEIYTQAGSISSHTPRIKMEDYNDYVTANESMPYGSPQAPFNLLPSSSTFPGHLEANYYPEQSSLNWPKVEYTNPTELQPYSSHGGYGGTRSGSENPSASDGGQPRRASSTLARTRQPRKLTTKEDANFQCQVKGCGKLFGRSYNYKAHMETHDASREYPFPCTVKDCNKKFVRKTDLQRHHQSVHMKQRNHRCDYCSRYFARKDTLRRHMEDGCSKRFDIETVDFRPRAYSNGEPIPLKTSFRPGEGESHARISPYSSRYTSPPASNAHNGSYEAPLTSAPPGQYYVASSRSQYAQADASSQDPIWNS
ncbi:C2H2 and C2HC zinc finger-2 [Coleophoma cylindrospora]|uniref:C2H2 type master regulator of conidiophore development brlA n=1 Tax=Coleophoma cylindrospora TaxID=1849047 RepID=A0A3D8RMT8_9HELO|nr:C2H2 and C2HC zinc finger-2 [Coleophoma cylindrospora]